MRSAGAGARRRWPLHLLVAGGLLALLLWQVNVSDLSEAIARADPIRAAAVVSLNVPVLLLMTLRTQLVLRALGERLALATLLPVSVLGAVAGSVTPGTTGDLVRTPIFRRRHGIPYWKGLAVVLYERSYSFFLLALSTAVAASWQLIPMPLATALLVAAVLMALLAPGLAAAALGRLRSRPASAGKEDEEGLPPLRRLTAAGGRSIDTVVALGRDRRLTAAVAPLSLGIFGLMATQLWLLASSVQIDVNAWEAWTALGASLLAGLVSFMPLGLGALDATLAALVGAASDELASGAAVALLLRLTVTVPLGIGAVAAYFFLLRPAKPAVQERTVSMEERQRGPIPETR